MKKTVIINETTFKKLRALMVMEVNRGPVFGTGRHVTDYTPYLSQLEAVPNLHTDRYKNYELEEAWNEWKNTGFDKESDEYMIYISQFKNFMFGNGGIIRHISYVADRLNAALHFIVLDPDWANSIKDKKGWSYSLANSGFGGEEKQCFYTTILKIYQNPVIWNDFFFNPVFSEHAQKFFKLRDKLSDLYKENQEKYKETYSKILPVKEYAELNKFVGVINKIYDEGNKNVIGWEIANRKNENKDLFYDPRFGTGDTYDDDEEEDYG